MAFAEVVYIEDEVMRLLPLKMISGLPPTDPTNVDLNWEANGVGIKFSAPDTIIEDQRLCTVGGAYILVKPEYLPSSPTDGTIIASLTKEEIDNTENEPYIFETPVLNIAYYFWFLPFSDHGVSNTRRANIYVIVPDPLQLVIDTHYTSDVIYAPMAPNTYFTRVFSSAINYQELRNKSGGISVTIGEDYYGTDVLDPADSDLVITPYTTSKVYEPPVEDPEFRQVTDKAITFVEDETTDGIEVSIGAIDPDA